MYLYIVYEVFHISMLCLLVGTYVTGCGDLPIYLVLIKDANWLSSQRVVVCHFGGLQHCRPGPGAGVFPLALDIPPTCDTKSCMHVHGQDRVFPWPLHTSAKLYTAERLWTWKDDSDKVSATEVSHW